MPQMIFVYFVIVSHFDALAVKFNEYSRLQGFETKGGYSGELCGSWGQELGSGGMGSRARLLGQTH